MPSGSPFIGSALRLGAGATFSGWAGYVAAFLASLVASLAVSAGAGLFWLLLKGIDPHTIAIGAVGLGLLWLTAQLLRALFFGARLVQASARLRGERCSALPPAVGEAATRSFAWFFYGLLLQLLRSGWQFLAIGLAGFAYVRAFVTGTHGALGAAQVAAAVVIALVLWIGFALWVDYAFARAIARGQGFLASLFDSAGVLWRAPWRPLVILVVTALIGAVLTFFAGLAPGELVGPGGVRPLFLWGALIGAALTAFVDTGVTLWRLGAFAALELAEIGQLPPPAHAEPIVEAQPIIEARPLPPDPGATLA